MAQFTSVEATRGGQAMVDRRAERGWAGETDGVEWVKSSASTAQGNCVEVAVLPGGGVGMRNSRDPEGPVLVYTRAEVEAFVSGNFHWPHPEKFFWPHLRTESREVTGDTDGLLLLAMPVQQPRDELPRERLSEPVLLLGVGPTEPLTDRRFLPVRSRASLTM
jgi:hypothetical protein